ncbi:hypothetical protein [Cellulomonas triticagri]|nr:hypothetical protein [Cellulomonas triticagri]
MGKRADELGLTLDADMDAMRLTGRGLGESAAEARSAHAALTEIPETLGLGGLSGDAATSRLLDIARKIDAVGTNLMRLEAAAKEAQGAVKSAQSDFHALPDGALTFAERAAITAGGTILMPGIGTVAADKAGSIWSNQREQARERAAEQALSRLASLVEGIDVPRASARDGYSSDSIDTTEQPSGQPDVSRSAEPRGYSPTVGGTGSGTRSVGTIGTGTPGVGTSWQPPVSSGLDTGLGGGSTGGSGGSGSGSTGGGSIGGGTGGGAGSGAGNGSGIGGGVVPGSGDGSSSDGLVGGTVPGGTGAGGGFLGGPGGSGSGASGSGSLGGVGAGGLAGGLTVGGAALGAAGLNRLAGGSAGAGGLGGAGGFGGGSFGGGTFAAGGGYGAGASGAGGAQLGTSGSALSGSTSGLGQGSQTGAAGAGASGARSGGGMMGGPMGGGGAGASKDAKRRASGGLLAPDIDVEDGVRRHDLGAGAGAGGRDALPTPTTAPETTTDDEW